MKNESEIKVPFLLCLKCLEDTEAWAKLVEGLSQLQKSSGGESLKVDYNQLYKQPPIPEIPTEEMTEQDIQREMESNSEVRFKW